MRVYVSEYVYDCVCEREKERERKKEREKEFVTVKEVALIDVEFFSEIKFLFFALNYCLLFYLFWHLSFFFKNKKEIPVPKVGLSVELFETRLCRRNSIWSNGKCFFISYAKFKSTNTDEKISIEKQTISLLFPGL